MVVGKIPLYWTNISSDTLLSNLIQKASADVKHMMEDLLHETEVIINFDEQIVFSQSDSKKGALWSLMVASGYLKVVMADMI